MSTMREIAAEVAGAHGVPLKRLLSPSRFTPVVRARWEAMARIRAVQWPDGRPRYTLPQIGRFLGRDHTTVIHGIRRHADVSALLTTGGEGADVHT